MDDAIRKLVRKHPVAALAATTLALLMSIAVFWWLPRRPRIDRTQYFYDLNTRQLFVVPDGTISPVDTPSGPHQGEPAGVQAEVFACGDCADASKRTILFLIKLRTPVPGPGPAGTEPSRWIDHSQNPLVKRPEEVDWYPRFSPRGEELFEDYIQKQHACNESGEKLRACGPGD